MELFRPAHSPSGCGEGARSVSACELACVVFSLVGFLVSSAGSGLVWRLRTAVGRAAAPAAVPQPLEQCPALYAIGYPLGHPGLALCDRVADSRRRHTVRSRHVTPAVAHATRRGEARGGAGDPWPRSRECARRVDVRQRATTKTMRVSFLASVRCRCVVGTRDREPAESGGRRESARPSRFSCGRPVLVPSGFQVPGSASTWLRFGS